MIDWKPISDMQWEIEGEMDFLFWVPRYGPVTAKVKDGQWTSVNAPVTYYASINPPKE